MNDSELLAAFDALFVGRRDVYAEGYPKRDSGKWNYVLVEAPLTPELQLRHMKGEVLLGMYTLLADSTTGFFAMDFDGDDSDADPYAVSLQGAVEQKYALERAGLYCYLERSRSGKGVHVWGFFDTPIPAATVRKALKPLLTKGVNFDRIFPMQDVLDLERKPYGNLIALPFYGAAARQGNSMFTDDVGTMIPVREFLASVKRNPVGMMEVLAAKAPKEAPRPAPRVGATSYDPSEPMAYGTEPTGALKVLSPYGCTFFRYIWKNQHNAKLVREPEWHAALQICAEFADGRNLAHSLFKTHKAYDAQGLDAKFDQVQENPRIGCAWIHEHYPEQACNSCPMKAPHWLARKSMAQLVGTTTTSIKRAGSFAADLARIREYDQGLKQSGIPFGIPALDKHTRMRPSEFIGIGARPSMGKTQLMIHSNVSTAKHGVPTFAFSAETGEVAFRDRTLAHVARVDSRLLRGEGHRKLRTEEWKRLEQAAQVLASLPLYIDYTAQTPDQILAQIELGLLQDRQPLEQPYVIWYDYLQYASGLMQGDKEYDRVSYASKTFKQMSQILEQAVVALVQAKRETEGDDTPDMTAFKESGRIEQDLNTGIIIAGERTIGERASRSLHLVKQKDAEANLVIPVRLIQAWGEWESLHDIVVPKGDSLL